MENRVIKFRAWDGYRMILPEQIFGDVRDEHILSFNGELFFLYEESNGSWCPSTISSRMVRESTLMQFTGLTDKNGVDGYEKDFVMESRVGLPNELIGIVKYDTDLCAFIVEKTNGGFEYLGKHMTDNPRHVFFGNIYENPELLNT